MAYNYLSFGLSRNQVLDSTGLLSSQWLRWFSTSLVPAVNNTTPKTIPGPYANDAAAEAGGVAIGSAYYQASGAVVVRLT